MSWATPAFSAVIRAMDYRFAFPSLPDHGGMTMERDKGAALMAIMTRGLSYLSRWRRDMGDVPPVIMKRGLSCLSRSVMTPDGLR